MQRLLLLLVLFCVSPVTQAQNQVHIERYGRGSADCVRWHPSNDDLLAVSGNAGVWLYDSQLNDITSINNIGNSECVQWSSDGQYLNIYSSSDGVSSVAVYRYDDRQLTEILTEIPDKQNVEWIPAFGLALVVTSTQVLVLDSEYFESQTVLPHTDNYSLSPSGERIAFLYDDRIDIYILSDIQLVSTVFAPEGIFSQLRWSPNDERLVTVSDNRVNVFDIASGEIEFTNVMEIPNSWLEVSPDPTLREPVGSLLWHPDHRRLIVVNNHPVFNGRDTLRVWDTMTGTLIRQIEINGACSDISWSADSGLLLLRAIGGSGYPFSIAYDSDRWHEVGTGLNAGGWTLSPERDVYLSGTFRSDELRLLNANTLEIVAEFDTISHRPVDWSWSPNASKFASVHRDEVQIWDVENSIRLAQRTDHILPNYSGSLNWHSDGNQLIYVSNGFGLRHTYNQATLRSWNLENNSVDLSLGGLLAPIFWVEQELEWTTSGNGFLLGSNSSLRMYDTSGNIVTSYLEAEDEYTYVSSDMSWNQANHEIAILQHSNNRTYIQLLDDRTGNITQTIPAQNVQKILWRPNSRILTMIGSTSLWLFDVNTLEIVQTINFEQSERPIIMWSPDGNQLALLSTQQLQMYDVSENGTDIVLRHNINLINGISHASIAWHPSSNYIALAQGYEIEIINVSTTETIGFISVPRETTFGFNGVFTLAWNPDGNALAFFAYGQPYLYVATIDEIF